MSARRPSFLTARNRASPNFAITRFSSTSGTMSAMVPSDASASRSRSVSRRAAGDALRTGVHRRDAPGELERDAGACEFVERVLRAGQARMHDRETVRELGFLTWRLRRKHVVVIGDDEIDVSLARDAGGLDRRHAAVDGDDERSAVVGERTDRVGVEPVALVDSVWDVDLNRRFGRNGFREVVEDGGRGDAVHVVVAVDHDLLTGPERVEDSLGGAIGVGED